MSKRKINTPDWVKGKTIYEVNLRQYTEEGTFKAFESHLPRLQQLGVGIIWFMPVQPIGKKNRKGKLGSYYSIANYTAVNPEFGTMEEFITLVQKVHDLGMKVIIDWVANHTAWDHHWTIDHPDFFEKDNNGTFKAPNPDWEDVIHLNYNNPDLWDEMIKEMVFWLIEADIDGFRCDMAHLVPTMFWNRVRRDLDKIKPVYLLAESQNFDLLEYAFDTVYNWKMLHAMNDLAGGRTTSENVFEIIRNQLLFLPEGASLLNFTSNHDENSWQGSSIERLHYFLEPLTVLSFLIPGVPLIYTGQEAGNHKRLKFFEKDTVNWKEDKLAGLYQKLCEVKKKNQALHPGAALQQVHNDSDGLVLTLKLSKENNQVLLILNLSDQSKDILIKCKDIDGKWNETISGDGRAFTCHSRFKIDRYSHRIFIRE